MMTLKQLVQLERLRKEIKPDTDKLDLLYAYAEIIGLSQDEVDAMSIEEANKLLNRCYNDISTLPKQLDVKELRLKEIEGVYYSFDVSFHNWKLKEFVDFKYLLDTDKENIAKVIAIFYRPIKKQPTFIDKLLARFKPNNPYELQPYDMRSLDERAKILEKNLTADEGYTLLLFFCDYLKRYLEILELYLRELMRKKSEQLGKTEQMNG
jgi:hypothetical protein